MQPMQTSALGRNREFDVTKTYVVSEFEHTKIAFI